MIELIEISKVFEGNVEAIHDLNLTVEDGKFVALLGPSGCGKTTTLMMLAGLYKPTGGRILFNGKDVTKLEPKDRNIGMVFQSYALYPNMTVRDNIAFPLKQKKVDKQTRYARAEEIARVVQIEQLMDRKPSQLSGGQQQRVAMSRALSKNPELLLLDEPMSNLDTRLKIDVRDEIRKIQQAMGITAIIVTHDQEEAMAIADKIAILDKGAIQQYDTPDELYNNPVNLFVAQFMGSPPMNFVEGELTRENGKTIIRGTDLFYVIPEGKLPGEEVRERSVVIGVRPHDLVVCAEKDCAVRAKVLIKEHLGREILVKSEVGGASVRVMIDAGAGSDIGEYMSLAFVDERVSIFDKSSGVRISNTSTRNKG